MKMCESAINQPTKEFLYMTSFLRTISVTLRDPRFCNVSQRTACQWKKDSWKKKVIICLLLRVINYRKLGERGGKNFIFRDWKYLTSASRNRKFEIERKTPTRRGRTPTRVGRVKYRAFAVLAGGWKSRESTRKKASFSLFSRLKVFLLEKTLRSFPFVDGPDLSKNLRARNQEYVLPIEFLEHSCVRSFIHGGYCIILAHQPARSWFDI